MGASSYLGARSIFDRRPGPAATAAGDGLEGNYTAVLDGTPADSTVKVIVPAISLTQPRTAYCSSTFAGSPGDFVLITFDEAKNPWVVATTA